MTTVRRRPTRPAKGPTCLDWALTDDTLQEMAKFRAAVFAKDFDHVKAIVDKLMVFVNESKVDSSEIPNLCSKLCDRSSPEPLKEALLTAICTGSRPLVEYILVLFNEFPEEECSGCYDSVAFMPHLTPIMLACICNDFSIVECLLLRGHDIDLPHRPDCKCSQCFYVPNTVANCLQLLDTYRALSSQAWLWLGTSDPFLAMIELSADLRLCAAATPPFKEVYDLLHSQVQSFGVTLIDQCRSSEEMDVLLRQPDGSYLTESKILYPRIRMALDGQMRKFLAHMNNQVAVENIWYGNWTDFGYHSVRDVYRLLRHTLFYPILAFLHAISAGKFVQSFNNPIARFTSFMTSYITFLASLIIMRYVQMHYENSWERSKMEHTEDFYLEIYIFLYVVGMILWQFMEFTRRGIHKYFDMWWRYFDFWLLCLFVFATTSWGCIYAAVENDGLKNLHRRHWVPYDLNILYDIFFGSGCIMAFWRIFYFPQVCRYFGSTIVSIGKCAQRTFVYFFIMFVIMMSFSVGCNCIMEGYTGHKETGEDGRVFEQGEMFSSLILTFRNLYWAFYGYLHPADYIVTVGDAGPSFEHTTHHITQIAIELMLAIYHLVVIITMLNMMITILVKTTEEVLRNEDIEWKYTRIIIYYEYFESSSSVPPPFNILHMITTIIYRLFSKYYVFLWPDLLVKTEMVNETEKQRITRKAYRDLQVQLFKRCWAIKEAVYERNIYFERETEFEF
ncbi:hypothetical protein L596_027802 [Steinernema carpocapsae]|uniref:Transient receptor ion channel domain-containing protein n=1 Tax=Steinernema carpocapsae TaxID=34508 RepID=A0A4V5ZXQ0_STECR|nr:hypothetical protein L596_027802 [Steinernema carpocapsae]